MRRVRVTYKEAYHYVMNWGIEEKSIFFGESLKTYFLKLLKEKSEKLKIRLLAYYIMDNHYCLVLQNSSGRLSDFMRELNSQYAIYYRKKEGKKGYVFQGRYKSILIQEGQYLRNSIIYVLLSPVREGIVDNPYNYRWSSIKEYFNNKKDIIVDREYAEKAFKSKPVFDELLEEWKTKDLPVNRIRFGALIGAKNFREEAMEKFDRRDNQGGKSKRRRKGDYIFDTVDNVIEDFEKKRGVKIDQIKIHTKAGKELRAELLVMLKDKAGLRHKEIIDMPIFRPLKYSSLGQLYKRAKDKFMDTQ
jgi:REP element-mobilizing transposase RayT